MDHINTSKVDEKKTIPPTTEASANPGRFTGEINTQIPVKLTIVSS